MPTDSIFDQRLRLVENFVESHQAEAQERWRGQFAFNKRMEKDMNDLEKCVHTFDTNLKVNNVKLTGMVALVQIIFTAIVVALLRWYW